MKVKYYIRSISTILLSLIVLFIGCSDESEPEPEPATYSVGGTVTGSSGTVILVNNGEEISVDGGSFTFPTKIADGSTYNVTVKSAPTGQICEVTNSSGTIAGANVTNVGIACEDLPLGTYTIGGTVTGLTGTLVISNNGVDELTINEDGGFTFATPLADGSAYQVTIVSQPSGELCSIANGSGTVNGANVSNVEISSQSTPDVGTNYFSVDGSDPSLFYEFQPDKSLLAKSNNGFGTISNVVGLAYDADNDITYAYAGTSKKLLSVNRTTGVATEIADIATSELWDLAYNKNADVLYGINFVYGTLTSINVSTGELTEIASDPSITKVYGLAYDAANDILYGSTSSEGKGQIISISTSTGVATLVGENDFLFSGLAYDSDNNVLLGAQGTDQDDPVMDLYEISTSNGSVTKIGPTGLPSLVDGGMTYIDGDGGLIASWGDGYGKIYGIDKTNGTTTSIGSSGYPSVMGLAWSDADLSIYGLVTSNVAGLVTYNSENGTSTFKVEVDLNLGTLNTALTYDDEADVFYTIVMDQNEDLHLASIDRTTGVGDTRAAIFDDDVHALAYNKESNFLYGATNRKIVTINATSGVVTTELDVDGLDGDISSMNFDPNNKVIVAITDAQKVFAINPISGESSEITVLNEELFGITFKEE